MNDIKPVVLEIQNVTQKSSVQDVSVKSIGQRLKSMIINQTQEKLENGNIKITLILDPKIQEVKGG
jgi:hypothetical protein